MLTDQTIDAEEKKNSFKPKVGFVVLTYRNVIDTLECLQSIEKCTVNGFEKIVIVVDNSETEQYIEEIKSSTSAYTFSIENKGYSHGNNFGIKKAIEFGCEYFIVLNNDTIVTESFAQPLLDFLKENDASIVAPLIYSYFNKKIWSSGGKYRKLLCDYAMDSQEVTGHKKVGFLSGCCFATTIRVFHQIGFLKEDLFMYNEDSDFCHRANKNGVGLYVLPESIIYHKISLSSRPNSPFQLYYIYRNRLHFARTEYKYPMKIYAVSVNWAKTVYRLLRCKINGDQGGAEALKYALKDFKSVTGRYRY